MQWTRWVCHLLELTRKRQLSAEEKARLPRAAQIHAEVVQEQPIQGEDWYEDDGR